MKKSFKIFGFLPKIFFLIVLGVQSLMSADTPVANNSKDLCYTSVKYSGLCLGLLGVGCKQTIELRNDSGKALSDVDVYLDAGSLLNVDLFTNCGVDGKKGNCTQRNGINLGQLAGVDLLNKSVIAFDMPDFSVDATHSIFSSSLLNVTLFSGSNLNAVYRKNGTLYSSKVQKCGPVIQNGYRDFTLREKQNLNGNLKVIGNTILIAKSNTGRNSQCSGTNFINDASDGNNTYDLCKYKIGSDEATSAELKLPSKDSKIVWAGLYWQSILNNSADATKQTIRVKKDSDSFVSVGADEINWNTYKPNTTNYKIYSAFADVSELFAQKGWNGGTYTVADVPSVAGKIDTLGAYGAWSLVVIYEDESEKLRNVSVFDGWKLVSKDTGSIKVPISGFLTPNRGVISAKAAVFTAEGDKTISGDTLKMKKGSSISFADIGDPSNNAFSSKIATEGTRVPSVTNNMGIDIQEYDVGSLMENRQTSTEFEFGSTKDAYWPSMIAFSTQLYEPDVCYEEKMYFNEKLVGDDNLPGKDDVVEFSVDVTNKDNETAKGVVIDKDFDKPDEFTYEPNSLKIDSVAKTDNQGDDTAEYNGFGIKLMLGSGANASAGGDITRDFVTTFKFKAKVGEAKDISENVYRVSYRNDTLGLSFDGSPIRKCADFDNAFGAYIPEIGNFNVVRAGAVSNNDPLDPNAIENALYTQLVNRAFSVDVIALDTNNTTPKKPSSDKKVDVSIVEVDPNGGCVGGEALSDVYSVTFAKNTDMIKNLNVVAKKASQNAVFKMVFDSKVLCSRDNFSIRPATFDIVPQVNTLVGAKAYNYSFKAMDAGATPMPSLRYNQNINNSLTKFAATQLILPSGCELDGQKQNIQQSFSFVNGESNPVIKYNNVGELKFFIVDNDYTRASNDFAKGDCVADSSSNTIDASGKIGCMVYGDKTLTFIPAKFDAKLSISNASSSLTYLSGDENMSANLLFDVKALLENSEVATNYTAKCYSKDVGAKVALNSPATLAWDTPATRLFMPSRVNDSVVIKDSSFENGEANVSYKFNFGRDITKPDNPFVINASEFVIESMNDGVVNSFSSGLLGDDDTNATFGFGRAHIANQRYNNVVSAQSNIYFEIYCFNGCNTSLLPLNSTHSDDIRWFINSSHNALNDGKATSTSGANIIVVKEPQNNTSAQSVELKYNETRGYPYKTTMKLFADDWLLSDTPTYNTYSVEFLKTGDWAGKQKTQNATKDEDAIAPNRRIQW